MARITRRALLGLGAFLGLSAALYPLLRETEPSPHWTGGGVWFEKVEEEAGGDEVELRFVDELGKPAEFSALLVWEPTGEVEEVRIRGGLRIPRRELLRRVDQWKDERRRRDQPPVTENTLLTILPVSLPGEALHYTALLERPKLVNKTYAIRGAASRRGRSGQASATCPEGRVVYVSDVNIREWIPAVALIDESSKAFGEYIRFSYYVDGAVFKINAHGAVSIGWGAEVRIGGEPSWSTGTLQKQESAGYDLGDGQSASVVFYNTIYRAIFYEVYNQYCYLVDTRNATYPIDMDTTQMVKAINYVPSGVLDTAEVFEVRPYVGIDGERGQVNELDYLEYLENQPLLEVGGQIGIGIPVGAFLSRVLGGFAELVRRIHGAFNFQIYGGRALYLSIVDTDAPPGVSYGLYIHRSRFTHYLKDYAFKPFNTVVKVVD